MDIKALHETGGRLFEKRTSLTMLWQEQAENFYPERADFTVRRTLGTDFASNLMTSYPVICRRELGDQIGTMLRPTAKDWFEVAPVDNRRETNAAKRWLQWAAGVQRRAMYDRKTQFNRAMKESDHDYACFGQSVESVRLNREGNALLYRTWHLRDVAWVENDQGGMGAVFRKWPAGARDLQRIFGAKIHDKVNRLLQKNQPFEETECWHIVVEADLYDDNAQGKPYWSIYYDADNQHIMEAVPTWNREYNIPRWQTVSGSQYAFSPATVAALPDARLLQAMTYTLLEAGEKLTNPPMVATKDAIHSDIDIRAGGVTWADRDYDERLGEVLRPITQDSRGMPIGNEMQRDSREMLMRAFFLNKLQMPQRAPEMTAYEVGQRVQEWIRAAMPIFEPMEMERNGGICELSFDLLLRGGAFGSPQDMPKELRQAELQFRFQSPLHDVIEQQKGQKFLEMAQYIATAVQLDQSVAALPDAKTALRDTLQAIVPAEWLRDEVTVQQIDDQAKAAQESQQTLAAMQAGSEVVGNLAAAQKDQAQALPA